MKRADGADPNRELLRMPCVRGEQRLTIALAGRPGAVLVHREVAAGREAAAGQRPARFRAAGPALAPQPAARQSVSSGSHARDQAVSLTPGTSHRMRAQFPGEPANPLNRALRAKPPSRRAIVR